MPDTPPARSAAPLLQDRRSAERNSSRLFQRYRAENELRAAPAPTTMTPNANRGCIATRQKPLPPTHKRTHAKVCAMVMGRLTRSVAAFRRRSLRPPPQQACRTRRHQLLRLPASALKRLCHQNEISATAAAVYVSTKFGTAALMANGHPSTPASARLHRSMSGTSCVPPNRVGLFTEQTRNFSPRPE